MNITISHLDVLLTYFYKTKKEINGIFFDDIHKEFNKTAEISKKEMLILLYKLVHDNYVTKKTFDRTETNLVTGDQTNKKPLPGFYISFDGILFFENVPDDYAGRPYEYARKIKLKKERALLIETWPKRYWWLVAFLAWAMGLLTDFVKQKFTKEVQAISIERSEPQGR